jgi:tRNA threonylcarbamoyladenosine biosynthesis protein TsaB
MRILALDTATENCSAALLVDGRIVAREQRLPRGHADLILTMVDQVLAESRAALSGLDAIAFGCGPGSFTGVRLGASVAQGLAFGSGVPVVPVSDLMAVAQRVLGEDAGVSRVLVCNDARMREVYWGCFVRSPADLAELEGAEHVSAPVEVRLPPSWAVAPQPVGAGTGFEAYPELRASLATALAATREAYPRAAEIALLAVREVTAGRGLDAEQALPVYLRDEVVQSTPRSH